jgi:hypothetical protein
MVFLNTLRAGLNLQGFFFFCEISMHPEVRATGHLSTGVLGFPVFKRTLKLFPIFKVSTASFLRSPPDLNSPKLSPFPYSQPNYIYKLFALVLTRNQISTPLMSNHYRHICFHFNIISIRRTNGRSLGTV